MRLHLLFLLLSLVVACKSKQDQYFFRFREIDFPTEVPFSIGDYRSSVYFIDYKGNHYMGWMHPDSVDFSRLERFYTEREKDSLCLVIGHDRVTETLSLNTPLAEELARLCAAFKSVWRISPKNIYLERLTIDENQSVWLKLLWKKTSQIYLILITNDFSASMSYMQEYRYKNDYKEIAPSLYCRIVTDEKW